ncbi:MAG: hypothetical protein LBU37_09535, partial [Tannerellaceae bacterium]|nr:hypothetical protein [Tannerellaceae bacterium]
MAAESPEGGAGERGLVADSPTRPEGEHPCRCVRTGAESPQEAAGERGLGADSPTRPEGGALREDGSGKPGGRRRRAGTCSGQPDPTGGGASLS